MRGVCVCVLRCLLYEVNRTDSVSFRLRLLFDGLVSLSKVSGLRPLGAERLERFVVLEGSDVDEFGLLDGLALNDRHDSSLELSRVGELGLLGVSVLDLSATAGEDDQSGLVRLQTSDVGLEGLDRRITTTFVDADTDLTGLFRVNTGFFELRDGETASSTRAGVVLVGRATNDRSQKTVDGSRSNRFRFRGTFLTSAFLLRRLIEPSTDESLPIFTKMAIRDDVIMLHHDILSVPYEKRR